MAASSDRDHLQELFRAVKAVIRRIPRGRVATYGMVAELAGIPCGARQRQAEAAPEAAQAGVTARMKRPASDTYRRIYAVVSRIPRGRVATYGQVAELARLPRQARLVGYALNVLPSDTAVPWHRVVNAKGQVSVRGDGLGHEELQAKLLAREGVRFTAGAIPLERFRWAPRR